MKVTDNTVLITGGGSGIGLALARLFAARGNTVIAAGRREDVLAAAQKAIPGLQTIRADVSGEAGRIELAKEAAARFPALNVLVNNAGIQQHPEPLLQPQDWSAHRAEIAVNLEAPVHLTMLLLPHLAKAAQAAIVNVTSGLAFVPIAAMSTYCLTKAGLHSFTQSLRHQLRDTKIGVVEIAPPAVDTDLGGPGLHTFGVNVDAFAKHVLAGLEKGETEIGYQMSEGARLANREQQAEIFARLNANRP